MIVYLPRITIYSIKLGSEPGWAVWALQRALNATGASLVEDGAFGIKTKAAVTDLQAHEQLVIDGVAGGQTQLRIVRLLISAADPDGKLPTGLAECHIMGESGGYLAAVNWNVEGGVDLGPTQRRIYTPTWKTPWPDFEAPFDTDDVKRALDAKNQIGLLSRNLRASHDTYFGAKNKDGTPKYPAVRTHELAWRLAVLKHNYPTGADKVATVGVSNLKDYWVNEQGWVTAIGARFPDGVQIKTPKDWMQHYSLGNKEHGDGGFMVKTITDWSTRA